MNECQHRVVKLTGSGQGVLVNCEGCGIRFLPMPPTVVESAGAERARLCVEFLEGMDSASLRDYGRGWYMRESRRKAKAGDEREARLADAEAVKIGIETAFGDGQYDAMLSLGRETQLRRALAAQAQP